MNHNFVKIIDGNNISYINRDHIININVTQPIQGLRSDICIYGIPYHHDPDMVQTNTFFYADVDSSIVDDILNPDTSFHINCDNYRPEEKS